jgi:hypothetical protein
MGFWVLLVLFVATTVVMALLAPRPPDQKPSALGDFQAPTAETGRIIPVAFGTVKMAGPNVTWYGDLRIDPIRVRSGPFTKTTIGYKYYLGMQLGLCHGPVDTAPASFNAASGLLTMTSSSPLGNWIWGAAWSAFSSPNLPADAVIQKIYAVIQLSHATGGEGPALAAAGTGQGLEPWEVDPGEVTVIPVGDGTAAFSGVFYVDTGETALAFLDSGQIFARLFATTSIAVMEDVLSVAGLGFAVYYTSALPQIEISDAPLPVAVPDGQGVAWSWAGAVEARPGNLGATNGSASGVAGAQFGVALYAGQAPDDTLVPCTLTELTDDKAEILMTARELFGGERREGGLEGQITLYRGTATQISDAYLSAKLGATAPAYHGLCHAVLKGCYLGTSNVLKNLNFILRRFPVNLGLGAGIARIGNDANPAEMIYETLTNTVWGLAELSARIDLSSFQTAATRLALESMGMSLLWDAQKPAREFIDEILRHIDGVLQTDPQTGLWTLTLARNDYDPDDLLELTTDDQLEAPEFTRGSWEELWNVVTVNYTDGATFKTASSLPASDAGNLAITGEPNIQTLDFPGFTRAELAQRVATRELKTHSYPFAKVHLKANRKAWPLRVGSVFKMTWDPTGIDQIVLRVLNIDYGKLTEGTIELDAVEDAFAVAYSAFSTPAASSWSDPLAAAAAVAEGRILQEAPFEWLPTAADTERVLVGATRGDQTSLGYQIWADEGEGYYQSNTAHQFCPGGTLAAAYARDTGALDAAGFTLENARDLAGLLGTDATGRARGDCLLLFATTGEICAFETVTDNEDGTFTLTNIVRGVFDTLPADHAEGERVFIIRDAGNWFLTPYKGDEAESTDAGGDQFIVVED